MIKIAKYKKEDDVSIKDLVEDYTNDETTQDEFQEDTETQMPYKDMISDENFDNNEDNEDIEEFSNYMDEEKDENDEFLKHIENASRDELNSRDEPNKMHSMLGGTECVIARCSVKSTNKKLIDNIKDLKLRVHETTRELEQFKNAELSKINPREKEQLIINAIRQPFVQSLKTQNLNFEQDNHLLKNHIKKLMKQIKKLNEEKKEYLTRHELDKAYFLTKQRLRDAENQFNIISNRHNELKLKINDVEIKHDKLADAYNQKIDEYANLQKQIKSMKVIAGKGIKLVKVDDGSNTKQKKQNFISKIFRRG